MAKATAVEKRSQRIYERPTDLMLSDIDALRLSGFRWECPFKYRCSRHRRDVFCKLCYATLISKLEDLGFSRHPGGRTRPLERSKTIGLSKGFGNEKLLKKAIL